MLDRFRRRLGREMLIESAKRHCGEPQLWLLWGDASSLLP
jgi:hypothetical protein